MTGILLIDKEQGWTSNDVVAKLRGVLHERKLGHAGTLDPLATGLLVVMAGRASRASEMLMHHEKRYLAHLRPGLTTDTQDVSGRIIREAHCKIQEEELREVLLHFQGEQMQLPPMYSAIKVKGQKLYEIARRGGEIERSSRPITISSLTLCGREGDDFLLDVTCSAGTYIRTLCHDIGQMLGCGACMAKLRRLSSGSFSVLQAHTISEVADAAERGEAEKLLLPVDVAFSDYPACTVNEMQEKRLRCGNSVPISVENGTMRVYARSGEFLLLGLVKDGLLTTIKSYFEVDPS